MVMTMTLKTYINDNHPRKIKYGQDAVHGLRTRQEVPFLFLIVIFMMAVLQPYLYAYCAGNPPCTYV